MTAPGHDLPLAVPSKFSLWTPLDDRFAASNLKPNLPRLGHQQLVTTGSFMAGNVDSFFETMDSVALVDGTAHIASSCAGAHVAQSGCI